MAAKASRLLDLYIALDVRTRLAEQGLHGLAAVVAGDVGLELVI